MKKDPQMISPPGSGVTIREPRAVIKQTISDGIALDLPLNVRFLAWLVEDDIPQLFIEVPTNRRPTTSWEFKIVHVDIPDDFDHYIGSLNAKWEGVYEVVHLYARRVSRREETEVPAPLAVANEEVV